MVECGRGLVKPVDWMVQHMFDEKDINWIECSLTRFRQGCITVRLDFENNLLIWKDSNRWFNDFVRNIDSVLADKIRESANQLLAANDYCISIEIDPNKEYLWQVKMGKKGLPDPLAECAGDDDSQEEWHAFVREIERAGEQVFDPVGGF